MLRQPPSMAPPGTVVLRALYGSLAHGTELPSSDEDWRGVFQLPNAALLGLDRPVETWESKPDVVFWELGHFCRLLLKGNPNVVGMLWTPDDCVDFVHPAIVPLFDHRVRFLHSATVSAYMGWAKREMRALLWEQAASPKRLSHVVRLVWELEGAVLLGKIDVRPREPRRSVIVGIKTGTVPYPEALAFCKSELEKVSGAIEGRAMPPPPRDWTERYLLETREHYGSA